MIVFIYILALSSLVGILYMTWEYIQGYLCHKWPTTEGVIVQARLGEIKGNRKEKILYIYYRYKVNDREYFSRRISMDAVTVQSNNIAETLLLKYPLDTTVTVWHHPLFHRLAVLETGPRQTFIHLFLIAIFSLVFIVSILALVRPGYNPVFELATLIRNWLK